VYSSKFCVELGTDPWLTSTLKQVDIKQMVVQQQQHERQLASAASATAAEGVVPALFASPPGAGAAAAGAAGCRRGSAASPSEEIEAGLSLTGVFGSLAPSPALSAAAAAGQYAAGYGVAPPRGLSAEPWEELDEQDFDFASLPSEPCGSWDFPWSPSPARREGSGAELGEAGMAGGEARGGAAGSPTPHGGHSAGLEPGAAGASRGAGCAGPGVQQTGRGVVYQAPSLKTEITLSSGVAGMCCCLCLVSSRQPLPPPVLGWCLPPRQSRGRAERGWREGSARLALQDG